MEWIVALIELIIMIWLIVKINRAEKSLEHMSKNLQILTENQRRFFESQMDGVKLQLAEPRYKEDENGKNIKMY